MKKKSSKLPEEMLTEGDVKKMIEIANHPRDKAIIATLYDTAARIGGNGFIEDQAHFISSVPKALAGHLINLQEITIQVKYSDCSISILKQISESVFRFL